MNVILISSSTNENGRSAEAIRIAKEELAYFNDSVSLYRIKSTSAGCTGCGGCKGGKGCVFGDLREFSEMMRNADGYVIITPVHYCGAAGAVSSFLSRAVMSETDVFKHKPAAVIAVGRRGGLYSAITEVTKFFEFTSSPIVSGIYPGLFYGEGDEEGAQNVRSIAANMHWITKALSCAKAMGIEPPSDEARIKTDISALISEKHRARE